MGARSLEDIKADFYTLVNPKSDEKPKYLVRSSVSRGRETVKIYAAERRFGGLLSGKVLAAITRGGVSSYQRELISRSYSNIPGITALALENLATQGRNGISH